ncbi:MAG TPA: Lrp/AsnC family transcriptional regulator [Caulobacteraceae bacterium]|jgi:DNA-binding Lrp family transcriptional regulator|nr:Lrp/AsnC family transcriptional regulator [Caulobacteraceae bacterium]
MDDIDRQLIAALRADARTPAATLAKLVKVSRGTVQNRIARLMREGEILGFTLRTPPDSDPHRVRAVMSIAIEGERTSAVVAALRGFPEIEAVHTTNGRWDLVAELNAESLAAFSRALDDIRRIKGIATTETSILLATTRF